MRILFLITSVAIASCAWATNPTPFDQRPRAQALITQLANEYGVPANYTRGLLASAKYQSSVLQKMRQPAEKTLTWNVYRAIFLQPERITAGANYIADHARIFQRAEKTYGVPPTLIAAIIGVETFYGKYTGSTRVLDSLATLAFDYPPRAQFFASELKQFLVLCHEEQIDPKTVLGSYAGAMGLPQFISSSYRHYAVDFNADGHRDLWSQPADIIGSVANYLQRNGWQPGAPVAVPAHMPDGTVAIDHGQLKTSHTYKQMQQAGITVDSPPAGTTPVGLIELPATTDPEYWLGYRNFFVITTYNHSPLYAMAVYQLSQAIADQMVHLASAQTN